PAEERREAAQAPTLDSRPSPLELSHASRNTEHGPRNTEHAASSHLPLLTSHLPFASAYIPFNYISDARQRIEIYRKLAQACDKPGLNELERELRDRFGRVPPPLELLLQVAELKILAAERGISVIEVKEDKLMLRRNQDYVMVGSKFPRLVRQEALA